MIHRNMFYSICWSQINMRESWADNCNIEAFAWSKAALKKMQEEMHAPDCKNFTLPPDWTIKIVVRTDVNQNYGLDGKRYYSYKFYNPTCNHVFTLETDWKNKCIGDVIFV